MGVFVLKFLLNFFCSSHLNVCGTTQILALKILLSASTVTFPGDFRQLSKPQ